MTEPSLTIGIVSPGAMGSALGRTWQAAGAKVITSLAGRSQRTVRLAEGLTDAGELTDIVRAADLVVSIVPPDQAETNADHIAAACQAAQATPVVADLNAIDPTTAARIGSILEVAGCRFLDGSISGLPPSPGGRTVLFLAGPDAHLLTDLPTDGLRNIVVGEEPGGASAVKMCTAAMYKGFTGLLAQSLGTARAHGVERFVLEDLTSEFGDLVAPAAAAKRLAIGASKADRFPGEMREIASTQAAADMGGDLYEALAAVFERADRSQLGALTPEEATGENDIASVLDRLRTPR